MVVKQEAVVGVISKVLLTFCLGFFFVAKAQVKNADSLLTYRKKVLETVEIDLLTSYYDQSGSHAAVTGGIGNEDLQDFSPTIVIRYPLNQDDVLTADIGISAYTSASSSNGNPFNKSGASGGGGYDDDDDDDDDNHGESATSGGSPWFASTGASSEDILTSINFSYAHAAEDRNKYWSVNLGTSFEYDYESIGGGASYTKLWNEKNTELTFKGQVFLDKWKPIIPTEVHEYNLYGSNFQTNIKSYFYGVSVIDKEGISTGNYMPSKFKDFTLVNRNTYSGSISFSQILSKRLQFSVFLDYVIQEGLLSNPLQRVYFNDVDNYYIGNKNAIANYTSPQNTSVFHLADDIERLPSQRIKTPLGLRVNYYINEVFVLRSYYRYYTDNWGVRSNTFQFELPIRFNMKWKLTPIYRFYDQTAVDYFAPYDQHNSSSSYYTSDYDLSAFSSNQLGASLTYTDIFSSLKVFDFGLKTVSLRFQNYKRSDGLSAFIITGGLSFVLD